MAKDCFKEVTEKYPKLSKKRIRKIVTDLKAIRAKFSDNPVKRAQFEKELWEKTELAESRYKAQKAVQATKNAEQDAVLISAVQNNVDPLEAANAIYVDSTHVFEGARASIARMFETMYSQGVNHLIRIANKKRLRQFMKGTHDRDIARAMYQKAIDGKVAEGTLKEVEEIANLYTQTNNWLIRNMRAAGVQIGEIAGYIMRQTHDADLISSAGFKKWRDFIIDKLDKEKTFGIYFDDAKVQNNILRGIYDKIVKDGSNHASSSLTRSRSLHFIDADNFMDYNSEFGYGDTLYESIQHSIRTGSRYAAITSKLGEDWDGSKERLKRMVRQMSPKGDEKFFRDADKRIERLHRTVLGYDERKGITKAAKISTFARQFANIKLSGVLTTAMGGDFASALYGSRNATGESLASAVVTNTAAYLKNIEALVGTERTREIARRNATVMTSKQGIFMDRVLSGKEPLSGKSAEAMRLFFEATGLSGHTRIARIAMLEKINKGLQKAFVTGQFSDTQKRVFTGAGLDAFDVANLQKLSKELDSKLGLAGEDVLDVDAEFFDVPEGKSAETYKWELGMKTANMVGSLLDMDIPQAGKAEAAAFLSDLDPDSPGGQAVRFVRQFKMTTLKMFRDTKYVSRLNTNNPYSMTGYLAVRTVVGGASAMTISLLWKYATGGWDGDEKSLEDFTAEDYLDFMAKGGGLGLAGDFILGKKDLYFRDPLHNAAGPVLSDSIKFGTRLYNDLAKEVKKPRDGRVNRVMKTGTNFLLQQAPTFGIDFMYQYKKSMMETSNNMIDDLMR